ncbi:MAG: BTAD domain-containing putative transcriptional regulator [Acidimicrobiales bacterium]
MKRRYDAPSVRFRVLGPLTVSQDDRQLHIGGPKQRLVLAVLLQAAGQTVSSDALVDGVWGDTPPATSRKTLQGYIHHLRGGLGDMVCTDAHGYSLHTDGAVDAIDFDRLRREGHDLIAHDPASAAQLLREALSLWTGPAYADLAGEAALTPEIARLQNLRVSVLGDRIDAELALGAHAGLIGELEGLSQEYPLHERFRAQSMLALYRAGRQVEALRAFERLRRFLAEEMGLDPSADLQELERRILARDPSLLVEGDGSASPAAVRGYELRELVGRGASSETYRAYQRSVGREVSVRILGAEVANDSHFIAEFLTDTQRVGSLEHPHIAFVFDTWREPGQAYQVTRWLGGGTLEDKLCDGPMGLAIALRTLDQVGGALAYAHKQDVIHGQVRASNVLFDETGNAYLSDFVVGSSDDNLSTCQDRKDFTLLAHRMLCNSAPLRVDGLAQPAVATVPNALDPIFAVALGPDDGYARIEDFLNAIRHVAGLDVEASPGIEPVRSEARNPYKGLRAFQASDARDFFGRDHLLERLLSTLRSERLIAVVGPSGSGKSSLVNAGLVPRLHEAGTPGSLLVTTMFPGAFPFEELEAALLRVGVNPGGVIADLVGDERGLVRVLQRVLPAPVFREEGPELILVIDQFEELFSVVSDEETRSLFIANLTNAVTDSRSRLRVVLTMRADFFDRPLQYPEFGALIEAGLVPVTLPDRDDLERAIAEPALSVGVELEPGLLPQILHDIAHQPGSLPLMQYVLTELFDGRQADELTVRAYQQAGGVFGALGRRAEELYDELEPAEQRTIRQAFLRLVTVDEGMNDLRRRVRIAELSSSDLDERALSGALELYGSHRLLTFDLDPITRSPTVEVAHEALLREWDRLSGWVDDQHDDLMIRRRLDAAIADWEQSGEDAAFLPTGGRLAQFNDWSSTTTLAITQSEREFVRSATNLETATAAQKAQRRRWLIGALATIAVGFAVVAGFALLQRQNASDNAFDAETRRLIADAVVEAEANPRLALLLAAEAHNRAPGPETLGALQQVMTRTGPFLGMFGDGALEVEWAADRIVTFDVDGLGVYDSATLRLILDVPLGLSIAPAGMSTRDSGADGIASVFAISAGARWAAVGLDGGAAALVDLDSGSTRTIPYWRDVTAFAFDKDELLIAVGDRRGDVVVYDLASLTEIRSFQSTHKESSFADFPEFGFWSGVLPAYEELAFRGVAALAFNSDASLLAINIGPRVGFWSLETGELVWPEMLLRTWENGFPYFAQTLEFSGNELVAHGFDTLTSIDAGTGSIISSGRIPLVRPDRDLDLGITYRHGADNRGVALTSEGRVVIFDVADAVGSFGPNNAGPTMEFDVPVRPREGLALSPDGGRLVVAGAESLMLVSLEGQQLLADAVPRGASRRLSVSSDGNMIAGSDGWSSVVWDRSETPTQVDIPTTLREASEALTGQRVGLETFVSAGGYPGGDMLVQYSLGRAQFYDGLTFDTPGPVIENVRYENSMSPDGRHLAHGRCTSTADFGKLFEGAGDTGYVCDLVGVNVVDMATGSTVVELWPQGETSAIDWSTDGRRLVHTNTDGQATVWDATTWTVVESGGLDQGDEALVARHSPDGQYLASVDRDGVISLRDPASGDVRTTLAGAVGAAAGGQGPWFSSDSSLLLTVFDGSPRLWDTVTGAQIGEPFPNEPSIRAAGAEGEQLQLVTGVGDHVLVWNLDASSWLHIACAAAGRNMSRAEWQQAGPVDTEYGATCPEYETEA